MQYVRMLMLFSVLLAAVGTVRAEQKFIIGNNYDFLFGASNQSAFSSTPLQSDVAPVYGFYPSVDLKSIGSNTQLDLFYMALFDRFDGEQKLNSLSHSARAGFTVTSGRVLKLHFGGSFSSAPDYTAVEVLRSTIETPDSFRFVFQPARAKETSRTTRGSIAAEINLNYRSYLTAEASVMSLRYFDNDPAGLFLDQNRNDFRLGYWYRLNPHDSVDVQLRLVQNDFLEFGNGRTQGAVVGYTRSFSPALQIRIEGGLAYTTFERALTVDGVNFGTLSSSYGYSALAQVSRKILSSNLTASYYHNPADSSGLGSLSDIHTVALALFTPLRGDLSLSSSVSGFIGSGTAGSFSNYKGVYGSVDLSYPLSRRWFLSWGGSYRMNSYGNPLDQEFKRLYMSLRIRAPEFWRTAL